MCKTETQGYGGENVQLLFTFKLFSFNLKRHSAKSQLAALGVEAEK